MFTVFSESTIPVDYPTLEEAQAAHERLKRLDPDEEAYIFHAMTVSEVLERYPISPWWDSGHSSRAPRPRIRQNA